MSRLDLMDEIVLRDTRILVLSNELETKTKQAEEAERKLEIAVEGIERLGSMEAFELPRAIRKSDGELIARITFAQETLAKIKEEQ